MALLPSGGCAGRAHYSAIGCTDVTVDWAAVAGADAYDLYRVTGPCGAGALLAGDLAVLTYDDTGLILNTEYSYYVVAKNACRGLSRPAVPAMECARSRVAMRFMKVAIGAR